MSLGNPGFYRRRIGEMLVTAIFDGTVEVSLDDVLDIDTDTARALERDMFRPAPTALDTSFFALERQGELVLVDTGGNASLDAGLGLGQQNLAAAGIDPTRVTHILLTHLHTDHYGGLLTKDGQKAFPNARLLLPSAERTFRLDPPDYDSLPSERRTAVDRVRRFVAPYRENLSFIEAGEVMPGINALPLPGHTPGHTGYRLDDGGESLTLWGDVVHFQSIQFRHPASSMSYDVNPADAARSRLAVFEQLSRDRSLAAGAHINFPGFGHFVARGGVFDWVPDSFRP